MWSLIQETIQLQIQHNTFIYYNQFQEYQQQMTRFSNACRIVGSTMRDIGWKLQSNFNKFKLNLQTFCSSKIVEPLNKIITDFNNSKDKQNLNKFFQNYLPLILAIPGFICLLMTFVLKVSGFAKLGVQGSSLASFIQSNFYGGFVAKSSMFSFLQSWGALGTFGASGLFTVPGILILISCLVVCYYSYNKLHQQETQAKIKEFIKKCKRMLNKLINKCKGKELEPQMTI